MTLERTFIERNRASTNRIRTLAARLSDAEMQHPVGEHWTAAITLTHLAFEEIYAYNERWVRRDLHRNQHLDEVEAALKG